MKRYVFMDLMAGPTRSQGSIEVAQLQENHLAH